MVMQLCQRFLIRLEAHSTLHLFEDKGCVAIFQRNLSFVANKFRLTIHSATYSRDAFTCYIEGADQSAVARAIERLQRFSESEILRECKTVAEGMSRVDETPSSIWAKPASCRRVREVQAGRIGRQYKCASNSAKSQLC